LGCAVLVVDNSYNHDIYSAVTDGEDKPYVIRQNITYVKNMLINKDYDGIFDYVIIWHGLNIKEEILANSDFIYVLPDYTRYVLDTVKNKITDWSIVNQVALRDSVMNNKFSDKKIAGILGIDPEKIKYALVHDTKDYENYLAFLYNGRQTFTNLTPIFNEFMTDITAEITGEDLKKAAGIYKRAKATQGNK
jgi:hypothetical protein